MYYCLWVDFIISWESLGKTLRTGQNSPGKWLIRMLDTYHIGNNPQEMNELIKMEAFMRKVIWVTLASILFSGIFISCPSPAPPKPNNSDDLVITSFSFLNSSIASTINGTNITVVVSSMADITMLTPQIEHNGASISPTSGTAHNFSSPVTYTLIAPDGSTKDYIVTVNLDNSLTGALTWISHVAVEGANYVVELGADEAITPADLSYGGKAVSITLKGDDVERIISFKTPGGPLFTVNNNVTLILDENITIYGFLTGNYGTYIPVKVNSGGQFIMEENSKITGTSSINAYGGGVYIADNGNFVMNGGEISGNSVVYGGGVFMLKNGSFTMNNGLITGNNGSTGGGVYMRDGSSFIMNGGTISSNSATSYGGGIYITGDCSFTMAEGTIAFNTAKYGGGVCLSGGNFIMDDGEIKNNTSNGNDDNYGDGGGGILIGSGIFTLNNGNISENSAIAYGGGVCMPYSLGTQSMTFTMNGGIINGNSAKSGGAVSAFRGTFNLNNGVVKGNNASSAGGGVWYHYGSFEKSISGGIIYGNDVPSDLKNTASDDNHGHAVYYALYGRKRNTTVYENTVLDSGKNGSEGGWE